MALNNKENGAVAFTGPMATVTPTNTINNDQDKKMKGNDINNLTTLNSGTAISAGVNNNIAIASSGNVAGSGMEALTSTPTTAGKDKTDTQEALATRPGHAVIKLKVKHTPLPSTASAPMRQAGGGPMPTPPNSISPTIPPARGLAGIPPSSASHMSLSSTSTSGFSAEALEGLGTITSGMLATHYLPSILLTHGPLAIRHIMGYLTTSVPGFSNIAPAKARRIVVGALEGKGRETAVRLEEVEGQEFGYGGVKGDVRFEKVGWGRWDARVRGQPPRSPALSPDLPSPYGMPISSGYSNIRRERVVAPSSSAEHGMDGDGDVDMDMDMDLDNEEEADRMSLDDPCSSSEAPTDIENDQLMGDDSEDVTDDEDWAAVGAAALRQHSYQGSAPLNAGSFGGRSALGPRVQHVYTGGSRSYSYAGSGGGVGAEVRTQQPVSLLNFQKRPAPTPLGRSSLMAVEDRQERDAVEALMRLGSV